MAGKILVTGATGTVGAEVVRRLHASGHEVVAGMRRPNHSSIDWGGEVERVLLDYMRPETFEPAFGDIESLFLVRPPALAEVRRHILPAIDAAAAFGVQHLVFLSVLGVEHSPGLPHREIEQHLQSIDLPHTILRPSFFMQNLSSAHQSEIRDFDEILVPAGDGKTSFVDARDIAEVAVRTLTEDGHRNATYDLTGSEAFDYYQVARIFSDVLDRTISYKNPSLFRFVNRMHRRHLPIGYLLVMSAIHELTREGYSSRITGELPRLLQREATRLRAFIEDYRACWMPMAPVHVLDHEDYT